MDQVLHSFHDPFFKHGIADGVHVYYIIVAVDVIGPL
jgi:hypothetical protein